MFKGNLKTIKNLKQKMDPYERLGVAHDATLDEIKRAYRRLALECHPDKGGDETEFKTLNEAYNALNESESPEKKTKKWFSIDSKVELQLQVTLEQIFEQATCPVTFQRKVMCRPCGGGGLKGPFMTWTNSVCGMCCGRGQVKITQTAPGQHFGTFMQCCVECDGQGKPRKKLPSVEAWCLECNGSGSVLENGQYNVVLSHSNRTDDVIPVAPKTVVKLTILPHSIYELSETRAFDLTTTVEITLQQALGQTWGSRIKTIDGKEVSYCKPTGHVISPGETLCLFNFGMFDEQSEERGHICITFKIQFPQSSVDVLDTVPTLAVEKDAVVLQPMPAGETKEPKSRRKGGCAQQ
jgi:DnaJ-class molecular chaperone